MAAMPASTPSSRQDYFSPDENARLQEEDTLAWRYVTGILMAVVVIGLLLGLGTVLLIAWTS